MFSNSEQFLRDWGWYPLCLVSFSNVNLSCSVSSLRVMWETWFFLAFVELLFHQPYRELCGSVTMALAS